MEWDWRQVTEIGDGMQGRHDAAGFILMEFTGLHDKNGKEIYEGDIIARGDVRGVVWYCAPAARFQVDTRQAGSLLNFVLSMNMTQSEVIGNIYENPGLIADSK